jgi:uncharacterized protein
MKKRFTYILALLLFTLLGNVIGQEKSIAFAGAKANLNEYKALYVLNSGEGNKIKATLRNINNALEDPRLRGKLEVELVAFGDGVKVFDKSGPFEQTLINLQSKGVILAQCENTIRERDIDKSSLFPFISFVPSGNGEIIIRHYQGWAIVHP